MTITYECYYGPDGVVPDSAPPLWLVSVEPFHMFRYLDEEAFRFNERSKKDGDRFHKVANSVTGKRLTYKKLIGAITKPGKAKV